MIPHTMTTTQFALDGYEIKRSLGIVRGIIVRSRSVLGTIGAAGKELGHFRNHASDHGLSGHAEKHRR